VTSPPPPVSTLSVNLLPGWNFVSLNVQATDMSLNAIFSKLSLSSGDHIKNQMSFADYYDG
jgi:hypothetical protein